MRPFIILCGIFALSAVVFQNCSLPNESTMDTTTQASSTTSTATSFLSLTALGAGGIIHASDAVQLMASGGTPPYQYSLNSGYGTIDSNGTYTSGGSTGSVIALVKDAAGATALFSFTVQADSSGTISYTLNPVYRGYKSSNGVHIFTTNYYEISSGGYNYEGVPFNVFPSAVSPIPVYRCYVAATGDQYLSNYPDCGGNYYVGFLGYLEKYATSQVGWPVYRCVQTGGNHMHIATLNQSECATNGYNEVEGILGYTK